jgi:serine/threonine-protein kinase
LFGEPGAPPFDVYSIDTTGQRKVEPLLTASHSEHNAEVSPNGKWLAYQSNESGRDEVYVRPFPEVTGSRRQVSIQGGTRPAWAKNGRELFYLLAGQGRMVSVAVVTEGVFRAEAPQTLFDGPYYRTPSGRTYDVHPDGKRFLMIRNSPEVAQSRHKSSLY